MATVGHEKEVFDRELPTLLADPANHGKYALLYGDRVDSIWHTFDEALEQGYERFGVESFLVRHIVEHEEPLYFSHSVSPCQ
jgi:hypothetical protein